MAGIDIQAKVKKGLARAIVKTSSARADLVFKIERTSNGGDPTSPIAPMEVAVLLVDAIFKSYHDTQIDQTLIMSGDRQLVTNGDVLIEPNDVIRVGDDEYIVQPSVDVKNPAGVPLAYIAQLRPSGSYAATVDGELTSEELYAVAPNIYAGYNRRTDTIFSSSGGSLTNLAILDTGMSIGLFLAGYQAGTLGVTILTTIQGEDMPDVGDIDVTIAGLTHTLSYIPVHGLTGGPVYAAGDTDHQTQTPEDLAFASHIRSLKGISSDFLLAQP